MPPLRLAEYLAADHERMLLAQFEKGLLCAGELWHELAAHTTVMLSSTHTP